MAGYTELHPLVESVLDELVRLRYAGCTVTAYRRMYANLERYAGFTDLAYDDFRVELERFAKAHPGLLEGSPCGLHAVAEIPGTLADSVEPGVVFCLKANDEDANPKDGNPTWPFHLVYVTDSGEVRGTHTNPKAALDIMRAACAGQSVPVMELCRQFNRQTRDGTNMDAYTELLDAAVSQVSGVQADKGMESLFSLGEVGAGTTLAFDDYSLVSFVVLRWRAWTGLRH